MEFQIAKKFVCWESEIILFMDPNSSVYGGQGAEMDNTTRGLDFPPWMWVKNCGEGLLRMMPSEMTKLKVPSLLSTNQITNQFIPRVPRACILFTLEENKMSLRAYCFDANSHVSLTNVNVRFLEKWVEKKCTFLHFFFEKSTEIATELTSLWNGKTLHNSYSLNLWIKVRKIISTEKILQTFYTLCNSSYIIVFKVI